MPEKDKYFKIHEAFGTVLYSGNAPLAPGTVSSLAAIIFFWLILPDSVLAMAVTAGILFAFGVRSASVLEEHWGNDPGRVTIDEAAGMAVTLIGLPKVLWIWLFAFIFFRIYDIFKPPPVRNLEFLPGGLGIMADDIMAGIYANLSCWIILWIF
ncbi:phosphatidylglycerophosphatase A [candidate division KSB1 bacterium]